MNINESYFYRTTETWEELAVMFNVSVEQLQTWNNNELTNSVVVSRQEVNVEDPGPKPLGLIATLPDETLEDIAQEHGLI